MKAAITGGRDYRLIKEDYDFLDKITQHFGITEMVTGGARGVDSAVEQWARSHGIPVRRFLPDWTKGRGAGFANNERMAQHAEALVAFPGGPGTQHMVEFCRGSGIAIHESPTRLPTQEHAEDICGDQNKICI